MLTPTEAEKIVLESVVPFHREDCSLLHAQGRVLRADLKADRDLPPYDRVTLDGYALRAASLIADRRRFRIQAVQAAGMRAFTLGPEPDICVEAMTGAILPDGADCVVPYEETTREGAVMVVSDAALRFTVGNAIHRRGADRKAGEVMVQAGTRITAREVALAAACGYRTVTVSQIPRIAVVSTGDELVDIDKPVAAHQVRRSNDYALRAALLSVGYPDVGRFHLRDVPHEIEHLLWHIIAEYDVVIVVGGVSKGKFDFVPPELERQGVKKCFQGVAQRPGKPMWFGVSPRRTLVFALPGNPVSCYTCFHRYVLPALAKASGWTPPAPSRAALAGPVRVSPDFTQFVPVTLSSGEHAELLALPHLTNTSGDFAALQGTDGFVEVPPAVGELPAGTIVPLWRW